MATQSIDGFDRLGPSACHAIVAFFSSSLFFRFFCGFLSVILASFSQMLFSIRRSHDVANH
jgi:hypothetical protein